MYVCMYVCSEARLQLLRSLSGGVGVVGPLTLLISMLCSGRSRQQSLSSQRLPLPRAAGAICLHLRSRIHLRGVPCCTRLPSSLGKVAVQTYLHLCKAGIACIYGHLLWWCCTWLPASYCRSIGSQPLPGPRKQDWCRPASYLT